MTHLTLTDEERRLIEARRNKVAADHAARIQMESDRIRLDRIVATPGLLNTEDAQFLQEQLRAYAESRPK